MTPTEALEQKVNDIMWKLFDGVASVAEATDQMVEMIIDTYGPPF